MAEYIERTEALEITTRTCGDYAAAWSEIRKLPAADVAPVVHGKPVTKMHTETLTGYHEEIGKFAEDGANLYRKKMIHTIIALYAAWHSARVGVTTAVNAARRWIWRQVDESSLNQHTPGVV